MLLPRWAVAPVPTAMWFLDLGQGRLRGLDIPWEWKLSLVTQHVVHLQLGHVAVRVPLQLVMVLEQEEVIYIIVWDRIIMVFRNLDWMPYGTTICTCTHEPISVGNKHHMVQQDIHVHETNFLVAILCCHFFVVITCCQPRLGFAGVKRLQISQTW